MRWWGVLCDNSICLAEGYIDGKHKAAYCVKSHTVAGDKLT